MPEPAATLPCPHYWEDGLGRQVAVMRPDQHDTLYLLTLRCHACRLYGWQVALLAWEKIRHAD